LATAARRRKTNKSMFVRKALEGILREPAKPRAAFALDLVRDLVGCVAGPTDLSMSKGRLKTFGR
jgi:hypothetical protein